MKDKLTIAKEHTFKGKLFYLFLKLIIAPLIKLIWVRKVTGKNNLPNKGPFIVAANHQSYFDFLTLGSVLPHKLTFLAGEVFYASKFWRPIMEYTGQIKVERYSEGGKDRASELALKILEHKKVLAIFPQGTRSRSGEIEKTYTGVARFVLQAKVPVVPVGIRNAFEVMPPSAKKPKYRKIIELHIGKPMEFDNSKVPRQITNEIMTEIAKLADMVYKEE